MDVSIVVPVHGEAPYFHETIKSIELQDSTKLDTELIIILDRPSASIRTLCVDIGKRFKSLVVIESLIPGIVPALNLGIAAARGRYIARIDSDDRMHPSRIRLQHRELETNPQLICVGSQLRLIDQGGEIIGMTHFPTEPSDIAHVLPFRNCVAHPSVMFRKAMFETEEGYRNEYQGCEDYDLWLRVFNGENISNIDIALVDYRVWSKQVTQKNKKQIDSQLKLLRTNILLKSDSSYLSIFLNRKRIMTQNQVDNCFLILKNEIGLIKYFQFIFNFIGAFLLSPLKISLFAYSFVKPRLHR